MTPWSRDFNAEPETRPAAGPASASRDRAFLVYGRAVSLVREVFRAPEEMDRTILEALAKVSDDILKELMDDNQDLLALTARSTAGNYLVGHTVNVAILSLRMAIALGWGREKLLRLGLAGLMHDIGMTPWLRLASGNRRLSKTEYLDLQLHVTESARILDRTSGPDDGEWRTVVDVILHERDRKAYVRGPQPRRYQTPSEEVRTASHILGVADAYEAMTHPRNFRQALMPHAALKQLIRLEDPSLDREAIRLLVGRLTLFPAGSYVRLSTGEIGVVTRVHPAKPMRPEVLVIIGRKGDRLRLPHCVNLNETQLDSVEAAVDETALQFEDRRLMAGLQAARWWVV